GIMRGRTGLRWLDAGGLGCAGRLGRRDEEVDVVVFVDTGRVHSPTLRNAAAMRQGKIFQLRNSYFSYKSKGRSQSSRRRFCTSVNGDNRAWVCPLTSTTLTLIVCSARSSNSALGRVVFRPG